ncbi:MAG TPA: alpha-amylase family protein, partial [Tepidisphaeraceae bacterium]|nr:alpha-amylase family protein [Tepidisphaeraceae bacterium]
MNSSFVLPRRQIHLDFHTGPAIHDVGVNFNARRFADTMKRAHVDSVTLFAKCHHGHLYYSTKRPERHPGLKKNLNLLGEQIEALHRHNIRAPIYLSVQCDEYAANTHPEWVARKPDGSQVKSGDSVFKPGWQILDLSSPYQDYLAEQTLEVLKLFKPVDGLFFDMCWDQPSTTQWAIDGMVKANLNPELESDRMIYARKVAIAFMTRFSRILKRTDKNATLYFNSRPLHNLADEIQFLTQTEIEALPSGGWGYMYFPKNVRYVRTFSKPYLGMTARFHKGWADFGGLKPYAALEYETSQIMAHGAACSIGDQLHPRGQLDSAAYDLIGRAYARVEEHQPWLDGAKPLAQIGVLMQSSGNEYVIESTTGTDEGAMRMLTQLKHQFNLITESCDFKPYELLILPDTIKLSKELAQQLRKYLAQGGKILATGTSGLSPDATQLLLPDLAIVPHGMSPFTTTYVRWPKSAGFPDTDHVMYDRSARVTPRRGATSMATIVEPYFERA